MQIQEPEFQDGRWVRSSRKYVGGQWVEVEPQQFGVLPMGERPEPRKKGDLGYHPEDSPPIPAPTPEPEPPKEFSPYSSDFGPEAAEQKVQEILAGDS